MNKYFLLKKKRSRIILLFKSVTWLPFLTWNYTLKYKKFVKSWSWLTFQQSLFPWSKIQPCNTHFQISTIKLKLAKLITIPVSRTLSTASASQKCLGSCHAKAPCTPTSINNLLKEPDLLRQSEDLGHNFKIIHFLNIMVYVLSDK